MKRSIICSLLLSLTVLSSVALAADTRRLSATPRITAVTVYADRAMTKRSATLPLKPGSYLVSFDNLPPLIQDDSVRVEGKGSAGVTITGIEVKRVFLEQSGEKRVKEIDDEIRALERQAGSLDARIAGVKSQRSFIDSIRVAWSDRISKELAVGKPTAAELAEASAFVGTGVTKAEEQTRDLDAEKLVIKEKIDALRRQRGEVGGAYRKEAKVVEVGLEVAREGNLALDLTAVTSRAGWEPSYDVRLAADGKNTELTFRALVRQQTGEDWKDVDLTLSTARPAAGGAPPELYPWRVAFFRPLPPMPAAAPAPAYRAKLAKSAAKMEDSAVMMEQAAEAPAEFQTSEISSEQTSVSFHLPRTVDIPSDNAQHSNVVALEQLPVSLEFLAIPKLSPFVFLRSEIINRAAYPLLPGKANIFVGNTFTGSSWLKKVAAGEKFDLFFGTDDQVSVKREELKQHKEAGLFGKNRMSYRYRIEVNNFRKDAQTVTVRDQLPVAGDEEIKVILDDPSLKPDEVKDDGRLTWRLPLKAGEKRDITFGIVVEYPKDREITGL